MHVQLLSCCAHCCITLLTINAYLGNRHKEHEKIRVLMRQEKTMKVHTDDIRLTLCYCCLVQVIANHVVDPRITLVPNAGSDRAWVWTAFDYTDGALAETVFAIRFGNPENAAEFKEKFEEMKVEMARQLAGEDAAGAENDETANEAAEAIESLSLKKGEEPETQQ
jgi:Ran-binding protein 1